MKGERERKGWGEEGKDGEVDVMSVWVFSFVFFLFFSVEE